MRLSFVVACCAAAVLVAIPARADEVDQALDPFRACGTLTAELERLACFDRALASADALATELRERRRRRTADDFGFSATQLAARDSSPSDTDGAAAVAAEEPEQISSPIVEIFSDRGGGRVFLLQNGQVWRQAGTTTFNGLIRPEGMATVSRGGFGGGYRLRIEGRRGFAGVVRVR